jgi:sodium/potassium-transporting ATPase subunit alpha
MIANVPQGLPTTVTASLYIVAERMAKQNVFVKKLDIIETLGSCSMICTDKTGTLTQNIMTVANIWVPGKRYSSGKCLIVAIQLFLFYYYAFVDEALAALRKQNEQVNKNEFNSLRSLLDVMGLNSRVVLERKSDKDPFQPAGDATEVGIYKFCAIAISSAFGGSRDIEDYRRRHEKIFEVPFNSSNKWQLSVHTMRNLTTWNEDGVPTFEKSSDVIMFKGAPDIILSKCSHYMESNGSRKVIDQAFTDKFNMEYESFGGEVRLYWFVLVLIVFLGRESSWICLPTNEH